MPRLMIVLYLTILSLCLALSLPNSFADTEFEDSVPLDVVKAFIGSGPYGETKIYSDLADGFPDISLPNEFEIIGSINRGYGVAVALKAELSETQASALLIESLLQAGYLELDSKRDNDWQTGFVSTAQTSIRTYYQFCHDLMGSMSLSYLELDDYGVVTASSSRVGMNSNQSCSEQIALREQNLQEAISRQGGLKSQVPRLELPEIIPTRFMPFRGPGFSSSNSGVEAHINVNLDWKLDELYDHFKTQIEGQGWALDSENLGSASATGSWTRSPDVDSNYIGTLIVLKTGDESFELKFQLNSIGGTSNNSAFGVYRN